MKDELTPIREYLEKMSFDLVTVSGTYENMEFKTPDKQTAMLLRHALAGDVEFAGGIAVTKKSKCTLWGRGN